MSSQARIDLAKAYVYEAMKLNPGDNKLIMYKNGQIALEMYDLLEQFKDETLIIGYGFIPQRRGERSFIILIKEK